MPNRHHSTGQVMPNRHHSTGQVITNRHHSTGQVITNRHHSTGQVDHANQPKDFGVQDTVDPPKMVEPWSSFPGFTKKLSQRNIWCFRLGMDILKPWEPKKIMLTNLLGRTGHLKSVDFSFWLSSNCPKIWFLLIFLKNLNRIDAFEVKNFVKFILFS